MKLDQPRPLYKKWCWAGVINQGMLRKTPKLARPYLGLRYRHLKLSVKTLSNI